MVSDLARQLSELFRLSGFEEAIFWGLLVILVLGIIGIGLYAYIAQYAKDERTVFGRYGN